MKLEAMPIKKEELSWLMQEEAQKEGWHYSQEDVDFYFNYSRNQITALKIDGELAGCVLVHTSAGCFQDSPIRSMGFYLVTEKFRGQKIAGPFLMEKIIAELKETALVCFHAVPKAVGFYERAGFMKTPLVDIFYAINLTDCYSNILKTMLPTPASLKCLVEAQYDCVFDYNKIVFSGKDAGICDFISHWIKRPDAIVLAYYEQDVVKGYGVLTVCQRKDEENTKPCYRLSPLYADSATIANTILNGALQYALQTNAYRMELNTLANSDSLFANRLEEVGFVANGKNYIVCNQPALIKQDTSILQKIFSSIPLEYPHEVTAALMER